jgi:hypothetical protein
MLRLYTTVSVIANPQGEAIHACTPDGFALLRTSLLLAMTGRRHEPPFSLSALLNCTVFSPMTTQVLHFATI